MTNNSIKNAFDRFWQHTLVKIDEKADFDHSHDNVYYTESEVDDRISSAVSNKADKATTLAGYGITDAAPKEHTHNYAASNHEHNDKYYIKTEVDNQITGAKEYAVGEISKAVANLLDNSTEAVDSIYELRDAMGDNADAISALQEIAGNKANASDLTTHTGDTTVHITSSERTAWNAAQANVIEGIKVNGTAQSVTDKTVNITVPTDNKDLANGAGYLVADDIKGKADKATTLAGYGITDAEPSGALVAAKKYTDDQISALVGDEGSVQEQIAGAIEEITPETIGASADGHKHTKSEITDFPTSMPASDVSAWAKASTKPAYTYNEVGAAASDHTHTGYAPDSHDHNSVYAPLVHDHNDVYYTESEIDAKITATKEYAVTEAGKAVANKVDKIDGYRLISSSEANKLEALVLGEGGQVQISGKVNANNVEGLSDLLNTKADVSSLNSHIGDTTHITSAERTQWNAAQANTIETIKVNGTDATITNKVVNIAVPTDYLTASDITNKADKSNVYTKTEVENQITSTKEYAVSEAAKAVASKADTSALTSHTDNGDVHITTDERTKWNAANTHASSDHAPVGAQANVIESIKVNGTAQTITSKSVNITVPTDNKDLANGAGYITASSISNKADKATTLAGYGITDAAAKSHDHNDKYYTESEIDTKINETKEYAVSEATKAVSGKANTSDLTSHTGNTTVHITSAERTKWNNKSEFSGNYNDLTNKPNIADDGSGELVINDSNDNIIMKVDADGLQTTCIKIGGATLSFDSTNEALVITI